MSKLDWRGRVQNEPYLRYCLFICLVFVPPPAATSEALVSLQRMEDFLRANASRTTGAEGEVDTVDSMPDSV
jgi:hypothetical protein